MFLLSKRKTLHSENVKMPINGGESLRKAIIYGACEKIRLSYRCGIGIRTDAGGFESEKIEEKIINCTNGTKYLLSEDNEKRKQFSYTPVEIKIRSNKFSMKLWVILGDNSFRGRSLMTLPVTC